MKILALSYLFPNAVQASHGIFVLNRLKALSQYVDIKVINPLPWSPIHPLMERYRYIQEVPEFEVIDGVEVYHPRFFSIPGYFKGLEVQTYRRAVWPVVEKLSQTWCFDLVDMHWTFPDLPCGIELAKQYGTNSMVTLRGMEALHQGDGGAREKAVENGLKKADAVVALSEELKQAGDLLSGNAEKSVVIRNGVDTSQFHFLNQQECRRFLGIESKETVIIGVGSLIYRKGFDLLIDALYALRQHAGNSSIRLYIIGSEGPEGDYRAQLYRQIDRLELGQNVVFKGNVPNDELKFWYNAANLFCLSSRGEGSPNVLTEAIACGCPVVSTDVGSAGEIVAAGEDVGVCVAANDEQALFFALQEVLQKSFDRQANALHAAQYDWDWCAKKVLPLYQQLTQ